MNSTVTLDSTAPQCAVCNKETTKSCSACCKVYYCGVEHQKQHRKQHKINCFPAVWVATKKVGCEVNSHGTQLQLLATRNIERGDLIFKEKEITSAVLGKVPFEDVCVVCDKKIVDTGNCYTLLGYLWPICSENCAKKSQHIRECQLSFSSEQLRKGNEKDKVLSSDIFHRCTKLKEQDAKCYEQMCKLARELLNLPAEFSNTITSFPIYTLFKIFHKNPCVKNGISYLFQNGSLLTHNCLSNSRILLKQHTKSTLYLKAVVPIRKGQGICVSFEDETPFPTILMGIQQRQQFLATRFDFKCFCPRCTDPTELNSYFSAIKCTENGCADGFWLPCEILKCSGTNATWICNKCKKTRENSDINTLLSPLQQQFDETQNLSEVEHLLAQYSTILHRNHYLITQLKYKIVQNAQAKITQKPTEKRESTIDLEKIFNYCISLQSLMNIVSPGFSVTREELLKWVSVVCAELCTIYSDEGQILNYVIKLKEYQKYTDELRKVQNALYSDELQENRFDIIDKSAATFIDLDEYFGSQPKCAVCSKSTPKISEDNSCSSCKAVFYCCVKHKKQHSKQHSMEDQCFPVIVTEDSVQGRFLVATRDIQKDELILREKAIVSSPSSIGGAQCNRICLGCYRSVKSSYTCTKCEWPMCDSQCENSPQHASKECKIFATNSVPPVTKNYQYEFVKALRCLLLRDSDKLKWSKIMALESHAPIRKKRPVRLQLSFEAINFIRTKCNLTQFQPEIIDHVVGVNAVNAFGLQLEGSGKSGIRTGSYLFYKTCMMSHSCAPNSTSKYGVSSLDPGTKALLDTTDYSVCIYANKAIRRGESVTTTYVDLNKSTMDRQRLLYDGYFFCCSCERCANPEELNALKNYNNN